MKTFTEILSEAKSKIDADGESMIKKYEKQLKMMNISASDIVAANKNGFETKAGVMKRWDKMDDVEKNIKFSSELAKLATKYGADGKKFIGKVVDLAKSDPYGAFGKIYGAGDPKNMGGNAWDNDLKAIVSKIYGVANVKSWF